MNLSLLCDYIRDHKSLSNASILEASTYTQRTSFIVKHRFLLLLLRRQGKKDVWLRLDRLRSDEKDLMGFVAAGGQVNANDIVSTHPFETDQKPLLMLLSHPGPRFKRKRAPHPKSEVGEYADIRSPSSPRRLQAFPPCHCC